MVHLQAKNLLPALRHPDDTSSLDAMIVLMPGKVSRR